MKRRTLDLRDGDAVIAEINRLRSGPYVMTGKWSLTQICEHLDATMRLVLDGHSIRVPRLFRALIGGPMMRHVIRTRRMMSGIPVVDPLRPRAPDGPDNPAIIGRCLATIERAREASGPLHPHPVADLTTEQWKQLQWVHAAHHLGFLVPDSGGEAPAPPDGAEPAVAGSS